MADKPTCEACDKEISARVRRGRCITCYRRGMRTGELQSLLMKVDACIDCGGTAGRYRKGRCEKCRDRDRRRAAGVQPRREWPRQCSVCGAGMSHSRKGMCRSCYGKSRHVPKPKRQRNTGPCVECHKVEPRGVKRGLCGTCYERSRRGPVVPPEPRFCSRDDCDRPYHALHLCEQHYYEVKRRKRGVQPRRQRGTCSVCDKPHHAKGYCETHYGRSRYKRRATEIKVEKGPMRAIHTEHGTLTTVHWPHWEADDSWTCPDCGETFYREQVAA